LSENESNENVNRTKSAKRETFVTREFKEVWESQGFDNYVKENLTKQSKPKKVDS
jgi:hypothetical protein